MPRIFVLILSALLSFSSLAFAERKVDVGVLSEAISENRKKVDEFRVIEEAARELNLRVWLFGGTAAGYAHYVKANLDNPNADYDFSRIYRSTQDADLVVDGTPEDAQKLEAKIKEKMSYLQGAKDSFEVRLLKKPRAINGVEREPLLNDPNFSNQNSDSHSLGLIELTKSQEPVVRDLKQWKEQPRAPTFLKDAAQGKLTFYKSPKHKETRFYKEGKNPEIFSAIRALTKAFQYDLEISPDAYKEIEEIVKRFDPQKDLNSQNTSRFNKLGLSMMLHASNLELAASTLDKLGLRKKLIKLSDQRDRNQMGFWLSKEPLRSKPVGQGKGRTLKEIAEELKIPWEEFTLSHETDSLLSYESMTRDRKGAPNVYISRKANQQGESAIHGDGFYTKIGKEGARGTGYTIRFKPDPNAREGEDFTRAGDHIVLKNKAALEVIPESFDMSLSEYFEKISHKDFDHADKALVEFLKRRMGRRLEREQNPEEAQEVFQLIKKKLLSEDTPQRAKERLFQEWFSLPVSTKVLDKGWLEVVLNNKTLAHQFVFYALSKPHWSDRPEIVKALIDNGNVDDSIAYRVLTQEHWKDHPELVEALIDKGTADTFLIRDVLSKPHWKGHPEWVKTIMDRGTQDFYIAEFIFTRPHSKEYPELLKALIEKGTVDGRIASQVLWREHWKDHPEFVKALIDRNHRDYTDIYIAQSVLSQPHWKDHPEFVKALIDKGTVDELVDELLAMPMWKNHPYFKKLLGNKWFTGRPTVKKIREALRAGKENDKQPNASSPTFCSQLLTRLLSFW
jgi:hypothetical protein